MLLVEWDVLDRVLSFNGRQKRVGVRGEVGAIINLSSIFVDNTKMTSFLGSVFADITELP